MLIRCLSRGTCAKKRQNQHKIIVNLFCTRFYEWYSDSGAAGVAKILSYLLTARGQYWLVVVGFLVLSASSRYSRSLAYGVPTCFRAKLPAKAQHKHVFTLLNWYSAGVQRMKQRDHWRYCRQTVQSSKLHSCVSDNRSMRYVLARLWPAG